MCHLKICVQNENSSILCTVKRWDKEYSCKSVRVIVLTLHFITTKANILFKGNVYLKYDRIVNIKETMLKVVYQVNVVLEMRCNPDTISLAFKKTPGGLLALETTWWYKRTEKTGPLNHSITKQPLCCRRLS